MLLLFLFAEGGSRGGGSILTPLWVNFRCPLCNLRATQFSFCAFQKLIYLAEVLTVNIKKENNNKNYSITTFTLSMASEY